MCFFASVIPSVKGADASCISPRWVGGVMPVFGARDMLPIYIPACKTRQNSFSVFLESLLFTGHVLPVPSHLFALLLSDMVQAQPVKPLSIYYV